MTGSTPTGMTGPTGPTGDPALAGVTGPTGPTSGFPRTTVVLDHTAATGAASGFGNGSTGTISVALLGTVGTNQRPVFRGVELLENPRSILLGVRMIYALGLWSFDVDFYIVSGRGGPPYTQEATVHYGILEFPQ